MSLTLIALVLPYYYVKLDTSFSMKNVGINDHNLDSTL